jgi:putative colanic acid biosynthesis acetyltransferase WcaF
MAYNEAEYKSELSLQNRCGRLLWGMVYTLLFRPSPWFFHRWRVWLLRVFGAQVHKSCIVHASARIYAPWNLSMHPRACLASRAYCFNVDRVEIGEDATVSEGVYLCTASHDIDSPGRELITRPVRIGDRAWIFAHACIGPGVEIGRGAVVAMGAIVVKSVGDLDVVGGNPARLLRKRELT